MLILYFDVHGNFLQIAYTIARSLRRLATYSYVGRKVQGIIYGLASPHHIHVLLYYSLSLSNPRPSPPCYTLPPLLM